MLMDKLVVETSQCRDILIRLMLNHEFWLCLDKIYLISPYGSETFLNDPPSLAVTSLQTPFPPPFILCWWQLISPVLLKVMCSPPPKKKKIYPLLMILNVKNPIYFSRVSLGWHFFTRHEYIETPRMQTFFIFLLPFQCTKNYLL